MSPQPKNTVEGDLPDAPGPQEAPPIPAIVLPTGDNPMAARQIKHAYQLEHKRGEVAKKINANRELLRLMDETDELSPAQGEWLDVFYALKENGVQRSAEEIEATRKMKEQARKHKVS